MRPDLIGVEAPARGADVLVVTSAWPSLDHPMRGIFIRRQVESVRAQGIGIDVLVINGYRSPWAYAAAMLMLCRRNFDRRYQVVHAHGGEAGLVARSYVRGRLLVSYMGSDLLGAPGADQTLSFRARLRRRLIRAGTHLADATITKSQEMAAVLPRRVARRNTVLPNGVDRDLFAPRARDDARQQLGWPRDQTIVLFAADPRLPYKRFGLAREACDLASRRVGAIRLEVARGLDPSIMPTLLNAADCLVHTSMSEGSPNVVKEALACDTPIVATPAGDIRDLLAGVSACEVCDPDAPSVAAALVRCLEAGRRSNGRESTEWLAQDRVATKLVNLYHSLAGPRT